MKSTAATVTTATLLAVAQQVAAAPVAVPAGADVVARQPTAEFAVAAGLPTVIIPRSEDVIPQLMAER